MKRTLSPVSYTHLDVYKRQAYKTLEAADYVGNGGTIVMRSDIDAGTGDKLVAKKVEGATMITVIPSGPASASRSAALITAEMDKGALFSLNGGKAAAGAWYYGPVSYTHLDYDDAGREDK